MHLTLIGLASNPNLGILWNQSADTITRTGNAYGRTVASFNYLKPWSLIRRCNLSDDGAVNAYWGNTGFAYDGSNGQVMVEFPKFYYRFTHTATTHAPEVSFRPRTGFKVHPWFVTDGREVNYQYLGAFEGSAYDVSGSAYLVNADAGVDFTAGTGDKFCSIAGVKPMSGENNATATLPHFRILAQNRGAGWGLQSVQAVRAIQMLYIVKYGNWNSQSVLSQGVTNLESGTGNQAVLTGATAGVGPAGSADLGNADGQVSIAHYSQGTTTYPMSLFGVENFYGNIWKWVDGINIKADNNPWGADHDFSSDTFTHPYVDTGLTLPSSNGYISNLAYTTSFDWGFLPSATSGDSTHYLCDYYYQVTGDRAALLGGGWHLGANAGAFRWGLGSAASIVDRTFGARLAFTPQI
jgi:hypothetical protein